MVTLGTIAIFLLFAVVFLYSVSLWKSKLLGSDDTIMYADSEKQPGKILYASSIPLIGKPDFILEKDGFYIPVEVKTGKTPKTPYKNHVAQLYAYCLLVEETYHIRPPYGILRYPEEEFTLEFPEQTENYLIHMVHTLIEKKQNELSREGLKKVCKECKTHIQRV